MYAAIGVVPSTKWLCWVSPVMVGKDVDLILNVDEEKVTISLIFQYCSKLVEMVLSQVV